MKIMNMLHTSGATMTAHGARAALAAVKTVEVTVILRKKLRKTLTRMTAVPMRTETTLAQMELHNLFSITKSAPIMTQMMMMSTRVRMRKI